MRVVVLGAGALGSILAAHLARAGEDVSLIARGPRARLLAEQGLTVKGLSDFTIKLPIIERPQELDACDFFILTAKTYDTQSALEGVGGLKPDLAMSVQNGVVKNEHLAAVFGWEHTAGCIANFSGEVGEDGVVHYTRNEGLYFGELAGPTSPGLESPGIGSHEGEPPAPRIETLGFPTPRLESLGLGGAGGRLPVPGVETLGLGGAAEAPGGMTAPGVETPGLGSNEGTSWRLGALAKVLNEAGIKTIVSDRILSVEWSKYATWMGLTAVAVLSRLYTHQIYQSDALDVLQTTLTREAVSLAAAFDVEVMDLGGLIFPKTMSVASTEECVAVIKQAGAAMEAGGALTHRMSALQDLLRGRRLEIEETFGYAVAKGAELGVPMPGLVTCYQLLAGINGQAGK